MTVTSHVMKYKNISYQYKNVKYYRVTVESDIMRQIASCLESLSCSLRETICSIFKIDFQLCFH